MITYWKSSAASLSWCRTTTGVLTILLGAASGAHSAVTVSGDTGYGTDPVVFTVDPFDTELVPKASDRGIAGSRRLRQTFKNPTDFNVGEIVFSFDVTGGSSAGTNATGLAVRIYEVDDVLSSAWTPGTLVKEITYLDLLPASENNLSFSLTGGDVFALPARFSGTAGYGLELSTPFSNDSDGNPGTLWFANDDTVSPAVDYYADGRYYTEGGTASSSHRDVGLALLASTAVACDPGDVNCVDGANLDDLAIIAAHFRQNGGYDEGDLTGNGFIDFDDFDIWKQNYPGAIPEGALQFLSVPEPTSIALALCGTLWFSSLVRRPRRRRMPQMN